MIRVYGQTDTTFTDNGDVVLRPLRAKVHKEDNGDYYLDLETGLEYVDYIVRGNIVIANTPQGDQAFRIGNVTKTKNRLTVRCYHVFYDSKNFTIPFWVVNLRRTCAQALAYANGTAVPASIFTTSSDITDEGLISYEYPALYDVFMDIAKTYGGHLIRDFWDVKVQQSIGQDNGITVRYKKNLKDITCEENWDDVCTKICPTGKDGIRLNSLDPTASLFIDSDTQYDIPYCRSIRFEQNIEQGAMTPTEYKQALIDDLRAQATAYLADHALPQVSYTLSANLEKITDIGDTIEVIDERLGINLTTHVIGFEYNCLLEMYTEVMFGNFANTLSGFATQVNKALSNTIQKQNMGILGDKQLIFNSDNSVTWQ